jgi:hypothetical protein
MLRDDYSSYRAPGSSGALLDDDGRSSVQAGLAPANDTTVPGEVGTVNVVNPLVTVRQRFQTGYDVDGNPEYGWHDLVVDREAITFESRTENSDSAGLTVVKSTVVFLYPADQPPVRETATVLTSNGYRWQITGLERFPDRLQLELERIEDDGS